MLLLARFSSSSVLRRHVAVALTLIAAVACGDPDATAPRHTPTQGASQDIDPTKRGPGSPYALTVTPYSLTFGPQPPNTSSAQQTVTVLNTNAVSIAVGEVSASGPFTQTGNCQGTTLAPGSSCTISVAFVSTTGGGLYGLLNISADNPRQVTLSGTATPWTTVLPGAIGFGSVAVGLITSGRVVKITNIGNAGSLVVSALTLGGANPGDFSIGADGCTGASLNPGASCTAYVSFEPLAIGSRSATVAIAHNATGGPSAVSLSGTGVKPAGGYIP